MNSLFGRGKRFTEAQYWVKALEKQLSNDDLDSLLDWLHTNAGKLNQGFVGAPR